MKEAVMFWLAKLLIDVLPALVIVVLMALIWLPTLLRQLRCRHDGDVNETSACDAICRQCGKNLGFIGSWRARRKEMKP